MFCKKNEKDELLKKEHLENIKFIMDELSTATHKLKHNYPDNVKENMNTINLLIERFNELNYGQK